MGKGRTVLTVTEAGRGLGVPTLSLIVSLADGGVKSTDVVRQADGDGLLVLYSDQLRMDVRVELKPDGTPGDIVDLALRDRYATRTFAIMENVQADYGAVHQAIKQLENVLEGRKPTLDDSLRVVKLLKLPMDVEGTDDRDVMITGAGGGVLEAGGGNDDVFFTGPGKIFGGEGADTLDLRFFRGLYGAKAEAIVDLKTGVMKLPDGARTGLDSLERVVGGRERDVILGSAADETFEAGGGRDLLNGRGGADTLVGGGGVDKILGGRGLDLLFGDAGNDEIRGGAGKDRIEGGTGRDKLFGEGGADTVLGGGGRDSLFGGKGGDQIGGDAGNDKLVGGAGADGMLGGAGHDALFGGAGADNMRGGEGDDRLFGGVGADTLQGDAGADTLAGGRGADSLYGGDGDDAIRGGAGTDEIFGGAGADEIRGGAGDDALQGQDGDDKMFAGAGDDQAAGGDGDDVIFGGAGNDVIGGNDGDDTLDGGAGDDKLTGFDGDDVLVAGAGVDELIGYGGLGADEGADEFRLVASGDGVDLVRDFHAGQDVWGVVGLTLDDLEIVTSERGFTIELASDGTPLAEFLETDHLGSVQDLEDGFVLL